MRRLLLVATAAASLAATMVLPQGCGSFASDEAPPAEAGTTDETGTPAPPREAGADQESGSLSLAVVYARSLPTAPDGGGAFVGAVSVGPAGDTHVVGTYFGAPMMVDAMTLPEPTSFDAFLLDLDARGQTLGARAIGGAGNQIGAASATLGNPRATYDGFIYNGEIQPGFVKYNSQGGPMDSNGVVARFADTRASSGDYGLTGTGNIQLRALAIGTSSAVVAVGEWSSGSFYVSTRGMAVDATGTGMFIARLFAPAGSADTATTFCTKNGQVCAASAIAVDAVGDSVVTGRFAGSYPFVNGGTPPTDSDAYILGLDVALAERWTVPFGGVGNQEGLAVANIPGSKDFVVAGTFDGSLDIPDVVTVGTKGGRDLFVARIDDLGGITWVKTFGGSGDDTVRSIAATANGIVLAGDFASTSIDFGGGALANADTGRGTTDIYLALLDLKGRHMYSTSFGDSATQNVAAIALDTNGAVVIAGSFHGTMTFGKTTLKAMGSGGDPFFAKVVLPR